MPSFSLSRARDHLACLAAVNRVTVTWMPGRQFMTAESVPGLRVAFLPQPRDGLRYLVGLHELGHCVDPGARRWAEREDLHGAAVCEGFAWAWAAANRDPDIPITRLEWGRAGSLVATHWERGDSDVEIELVWDGEPGASEPQSDG